jgi:hypothetical protein
MPNNLVNQTAGSSVALVAVKFSGRRWLPLALGGSKSGKMGAMKQMLSKSYAFIARWEEIR